MLGYGARKLLLIEPSMSSVQNARKAVNSMTITCVQFCFMMMLAPSQIRFWHLAVAKMGGPSLMFLATVCSAELLVLPLGRQDRILHGIRVSSFSLCVRV